MSDLREMSREFIKHFIELYKSYPCLWQIKSKDYLNKNKKNEGYEALVNKLKTVQPNADRKTVTSKINSLRGSFRREYKKVQESRRAGSAADDVYLPTLWYYEDMLFLRDEEIPSWSVSNEREIDEENYQSDKESPTTALEDDVINDSATYIIQYPANASPKLEETSFSSQQEQRGLTQPTSVNLPLNQCDNEETVVEKPVGLSVKKRKISEQSKQIFTSVLVKKAIDLLQQPNDPEQIFGDYVATELRQLRNSENKRKLRRLINQAIMEMSDLDAAEQNVSRPFSAYSHNSNS